MDYRIGEEMSEILTEKVYGELKDLEWKCDRQKYILATMLSTVPEGVTFPHGETDLQRQLQRILYKERDNPLIRSAFRFSESSHLSRDLYDLVEFGGALGIESMGLDYESRTTKKVLEIAGEAKRFLPRDDYEYLISLGKKLRGWVRK